MGGYVEVEQVLCFGVLGVVEIVEVVGVVCGG